jgi:hypothetical protein
MSLFNNVPAGAPARVTCYNSSSEDLPISPPARPYRLSPAPKSSHLLSSLRDRLASQTSPCREAPRAPLLPSPAALSASLLSPTLPPRRPHTSDSTTRPTGSRPSATARIAPATNPTVPWSTSTSLLLTPDHSAQRRRGHSVDADVSGRSPPRPSHGDRRRPIVNIPPFSGDSQPTGPSPRPSRPSAARITPQARSPRQAPSLPRTQEPNPSSLDGDRTRRTANSTPLTSSTSSPRRAQAEDPLIASLRDLRAGSGVTSPARSTAPTPPITNQQRHRMPVNRPSDAENDEAPPPPYCETDPRPAPQGAAVEDVVRELGRADTISFPPRYSAVITRGSPQERMAPGQRRA